LARQKQKDRDVAVAIASRKLLAKATLGELHDLVKASGPRAVAESLMCDSVPKGIQNAVVRAVAQLLERYA